jgi:hypothetical protein
MVRKPSHHRLLPVVLVLALVLPASIVSDSAHAAKKKAKKRVVATVKVMNIIEKIEASLLETRYQHVTRVRPHRGEYFFDCSGMASWILRRSAPNALRVVGKPNGKRPLAVHFFKKIARIPIGEKRGPWERVRTAAHARPGDMIAWIRPKWFPSKSTGHVAFVVGSPKINHGPVPGILVRIADASKFKHEDDSRDADVTGYGTGVLLIPTDEKAQPTGYGWVGSHTKPDWVVPTELVIGRPLR